VTLDAIVVDPAGAPVNGSLRPDAWWRHPDDGRVVSEQQLMRLAGHRQAWRGVKKGRVRQKVEA